MRYAFYASLAVVPWVAFTLLLRFLMNEQGWPVGLVGTLSRVVTVPLLIAWILATGAGWRRLRPRGVLGWLLLMGMLSIAINLLWFASVKWTTATNVAMLFRLDLVFVVLIGAALGLERIGPVQVVLVPLMFVGLALVAEVHRFDLGGHVVGDLMVVVAALGLATNAFVIRHILRAMDEEAVALYNHSISMLGFLLLALISGDFARTPEVFASSSSWLAMGLLGVVGAVGLPLYYVALGRMDVWKLRTFMLVTPVLTVAIEWPLWGVRLSALQGLGALVILGGLAALIHIESRGQDVEKTEPSARTEPAAQRPTAVTGTGTSNWPDPLQKKSKRTP